MAKPVPLFRGTPENGIMFMQNIAEWSRYLQTLDRQYCEITVRKYRKKRSNKQNAYFHGVVCFILGNHWGYTVEEAHSAICGEFLRVEEYGKPAYIRSTTDLSTVEFNEFLEQIKLWAATKFNVFIPDPEKVDV